MRRQQQRQASDLHEPVLASHLEVRVDGQDFERSLRRFTKKVKAEGTLQLFSERSSYTKPSEARRKKSRLARRRAKAAAAF